MTYARFFPVLIVLAVSSLAIAGCSSQKTSRQPTTSPEQALASAKVVAAPLKLASTQELLLTWADAEGVHTVSSVLEIPKEARRFVRVTSPDLAAKQATGAKVYVADLRRYPQSKPSFRLVAREDFDRWVESLEDGPQATVTLYGAPWCGACRQARAYLRRQGVAFTDKNIDAEPQARREMARKLQQAGLHGTSIPVLDIYGKVVQGFSPGRVKAALARGR